MELSGDAFLNNRSFARSRRSSCDRSHVPRENPVARYGFKVARTCAFSVVGSPVAMPIQPQVGPWVGVLQVRGCSLIKRKIPFSSPSLSLATAALFLGKKGKKTDETETDGEKKKEDREGERERRRNGEGTKEKGRRRKRETGPHFYLRGKRKRPKGVNQAARLAGTLRERHARTSFFPFSSSPRLSHRIFLISLPLLLLCVFFVHDPAVTLAEALFLLARITTILTTVRTRM